MKLQYVELKEDKSRITRKGMSYESMNGLRNAGLLLNDNVVLVDFDNDNKNENKIMFNYFSKKRNKGY